MFISYSYYHRIAKNGKRRKRENEPRNTRPGRRNDQGPIAGTERQEDGRSHRNRKGGPRKRANQIRGKERKDGREAGKGNQEAGGVRNACLKWGQERL